MYLLDVVKANAEIGKLNESVKAVIAEKETLVKSIAEFESQIKQHIETSQTLVQLKESHAAELTKLKADYEAKLVDKDKELGTLKATKEKEISTVKASVAEESIRIVASQGTNVVIPSESKPSDSAPALWEQYKGMRKNSPEAQSFYAEHHSLFEEMRKSKLTTK